MQNVNMRHLLFFITGLFLTSLISCGKKDPGIQVFNTEMNAIAVLSNGDTMKIHATNAKAPMGQSPLGGGTFLSGTNEANAALYLTINDSMNFSSGVYLPGTYATGFSCEFRKNTEVQMSPVYYTYNVSANTRRITFTKLDGHLMEGYFYALCKDFAGTDSVRVSGTFKGEY